MAKPKFNFKSSGTRRGENIRFDEVNIIENSIGIKTPMELGDDRKNLYATHKDPVQQIKDNLRNLVLTNFGERLGRPELGADLISITFDSDQIADFLNLSKIKITEAVNKYMPFIFINDIQYVSNNATQNQLNTTFLSDSVGVKEVSIIINYNISQINLINQMLQVNVFAGG